MSRNASQLDLTRPAGLGNQRRRPALRPVFAGDRTRLGDAYAREPFGVTAVGFFAGSFLPLTAGLAGFLPFTAACLVGFLAFTAACLVGILPFTAACLLGFLPFTAACLVSFLPFTAACFTRLALFTAFLAGSTTGFTASSAFGATCA